MPPAIESLTLQSQDRQSTDWIASAGFDLAFFILSPLAGLAFMLLHPFGGQPLAIVAAAMIGGPHYVASLSFYFWDDVRADHRHRWFAHYVAPAAILAAVLAVAWLKVPVLIVPILYFWNAVHVARQSCGILSIYRHRAGVFGAQHKTAANTAIVTTNLSMALAHTEWYPSLHRLLSLPSGALPELLWQVSAAIAAASLLMLGKSLLERYRAGKAPRGAELAFLLTSLTLFHPYLWVRDGDLATLVMLLGHFIQYLGIMWLLNNRKFARSPGAQGSYGQRMVARLWCQPGWLLPAALVAGGLFLLLQLQAMTVSIALVLVHFYLDGIFWAFRRPSVRAAIAPHLTGLHRAPPEAPRVP